VLAVKMSTQDLENIAINNGKNLSIVVYNVGIKIQNKAVGITKREIERR
tara:strand:+ start:67 stop:213 length:147 start_codon:yes stop_codon:yes gene_type:complete